MTGEPVQEADAAPSALEDPARRAAAGDVEALDALVAAVYNDGIARRAVSSILISADDIEDAEQEAVIAMARSIGSFRGESAFETWLWTIGKRSAIAVLRRKHRSEAFDDDVASEGEVMRISSMIADRRTLENVIAVLPERYAAAVYLRDVEGKSYDEIAAHLDMKLNTVRTRIARGRALAAAALEGGR